MGRPHIPNARFTVAATENPAYTKAAQDPSRCTDFRADLWRPASPELAPLVYEARSWQHGVLVGASVAGSETTAAQTGAVGAWCAVIRWR